MCVAALLFQYGYESINKFSMPTESFRVLSDEMWDSLSEYIGAYHTPTIFQSNVLVLQGYFQKSAPLMKHRMLILKNLKSDFEVVEGITMSDLLTARPPIEVRDTDVVVHVRLGDYRDVGLVASPAGQLAILRSLKPERVIIVCQKPGDTERAYLKFFEEFHPIFQHGTELEDFATLRSAKRLIVTNSSFSWAAAYFGEGQRWIPNGDLGKISETDILYDAGTFDLSTLDIPTETAAVTGEFLQSLCDYTVLDQEQKMEFHKWIDMVVPIERQLFLEEPWPDAVSLFVYPKDGLLEAVAARTWPSLRLIVSHNGDNPVNYKVLIPFLEANPKVHAWVLNNTVKHPRIRTIPIAEQNRMWRGGTYEWDPPVTVKHGGSRSRILFTACSPTNPIRKEWIDELRPLASTLKEVDYVPRVPRDEFIELLGTYKMVVCPPGNGVDTHRHWESIYNGAWAAVHNNEHTRRLLEEYPSLPLIPINSVRDLSTPQGEPEFHPLILRQFWMTLFSSYVDQLSMNGT